MISVRICEVKKKTILIQCGYKYFLGKFSSTELNIEDNVVAKNMP